MGTNVIIIQTWWGALYLMEPFNLVHLTTKLLFKPGLLQYFKESPFKMSGSRSNREFSDLAGRVEMVAIDLFR